MNTRKRGTFAIPLALPVALLLGGGVSAQDPPSTVEGEVVQVMQQARTGEPGGLDAVMIRTREGERTRLLLGAPGSCEGCVQVGDRVRARLSKSGSTADGYAVRSMRVERTGAKTRFRDGSGQLLQARSRDQNRDRSAVQARSRDCAGSGRARPGGSRGRR